MNLTEFIQKYQHTRVDFDGRYGDQCVDLFNRYLVDCLGINNPIQMFPVASAYQIWDYAKDNPHFTRYENTPTAVPKEGDIMIWEKSKSLPHGHVAIYVSGDVNSFQSLDQNWPVGNDTEIITHDYLSPKVVGWIRSVKNEVPGEKPKPPFIDLVKFWNSLDGNKTYAAVIGMFLTIVAYNLGYITEEQFNMFDTLFLALMGFSLRDAIKKK